MGKTGFTLIEILIVVIIMGILASIALPQYRLTVARARYTKLMPILKALKNAQEEYWLVHREYASTFDQLGFHSSGFTLANSGSDPKYNDQTSKFYQQSMTNGGITIILDRNGGGAPCVWGRIRLGGKPMGFVQYLDKMSPGSASFSGRRYCYSYTGDTNDWRYRLCRSLTGSPSHESWEGPTRFRFTR